MGRRISKGGTWCSLHNFLKTEDPGLLFKHLGVREWNAPLYHACAFFTPHQEVQLEQEAYEGEIEVKMEVFGWGTGEKGFPKLLCWTRRENWLMPEKAARGRCVLGTEVRGGITHRQQETGKVQFRQSQEKWEGIVPISGEQARNPYKEQKLLQRAEKFLHRAEIPTKSRNPYAHESQFWQGQTVVAENLFQMVRPSWEEEIPVGTHTGLLQIHSHHFQSWTTAENQGKSQLVLGAAFLSRADTGGNVRFSTFPSPAKEEVRKSCHC